MTDAPTGASMTAASESGVMTVHFSEPGLPPARGAIRCEVNAKGELELYPNDALGAYFLRQFGHGEVRVVWSYRGVGPERSPTQNFTHLIIRCETHPLLSKGPDTFHTAVPLTAAEHKACRELVDEMRTPKAAPKARIRARTRKAKP